MRVRAGFAEAYCKACMERLAFFVARHPIAIIVVTTSLTASMIVAGYFTFTYDTEFFSLAVMTDSRAMKDRQIVEANFPLNSTYFSLERLTRIQTLSVVNIKAKDDGPITRLDVLDEAKRLHREIYAMAVEYNGRNYTYKDICGWIRRNECFITNIDDVTPNTMYPVTFDRKGRMVKTVAFYSKPEKCKSNGLCKLDGSLALRLMYFPRAHNQTAAAIAKLWQQKFAEICRRQYEHLEMNFISTPELDQEITNTSHLVADKMLYIVVAVWLFSVLSGWNSDCVRWQPWLTSLGLTSMLLAVCTSCGLMLFLGVPFVPNNVAMVVLLAGVGMDDTFVIINIWRQTKLGDPVLKRLQETYSEAGVAITITSVTNAICLYMSYVIPIKCFRIFSLYAGTGILVVYFYQITFFGAVIALIGRRENANKHGWLPAVKVTPKSMAGSKSFLVRFFCTGGINPDDPDNRLDRDWNVIQRTFARGIYSLLTARLSPLIIIASYVVYLSFALYGITQLKVGFLRQDLLPDNSNVAKYFEMEDRYFRHMPYGVMGMLSGDIDYSDLATQRQLDELVQRFVMSKYGSQDDRGLLFWLNNYKKFLSANSGKYGELISRDKFIEILKNDFLPSTEFMSDIVFDPAGRRILTSRFFFPVMNASNSAEDEAMMLHLRAIADTNGNFNLTVFNYMFVIFDQYLEIIPTTLQCIILSTAIMFLICAVFISNGTSSLWVAFTILSVQLGLAGYMSLLRIHLDYVSAFVIIMSIGFSVDYGAHISYAFAHAQTRGLRGVDIQILDTLERIGWPIFQGGLSTLLAISPQYMAPSYVYRTNVTILCLMISFGVLHALFLIPTMLRLIGKRSEAKWIPVKTGNGLVGENTRNGTEMAVKFLK